MEQDVNVDEQFLLALTSIDRCSTLEVYCSPFLVVEFCLDKDYGYWCSNEIICLTLPETLKHLFGNPSGDWGCCPFPNAVCCSDHIHCCPQGTQCDPEKLHCTKTNGEIFPPRRKGNAQQSTDENEIICPDRRSKCPSGSTCCMLVSGKYGCCPVEGANCCADHLHCCPSGFTCDTSGQRCIQDKASRGSALSLIFIVIKFQIETFESNSANSTTVVGKLRLPGVLRPENGISLQAHSYLPTSFFQISRSGHFLESNPPTTKINK
ncbi:unnamed protein product [Haemonchus placei]|uniref:Granulin n=1 Tax=Haemonchus placei TaxID=6290 RepID=A0A0N4X0T5_HAEPC|nr:unnamed protein product [Haemonchus placei]